MNSKSADYDTFRTSSFELIESFSLLFGIGMFRE